MPELWENPEALEMVKSVIELGWEALNWLPHTWNVKSVWHLVADPLVQMEWRELDGAGSGQHLLYKYWKPQGEDYGQ